MATVEFTGDDRPALLYISERGYASYSSAKNVRDVVIPSIVNEIWFTFGKELHSRLLENKALSTLTDAEEMILDYMLAALRAHSVVKKLLKHSINEIDFGPQAVLDKYESGGILAPHIFGLPMFGRIDVLNGTLVKFGKYLKVDKVDNVCDLKTTRLTSMRQFVESMDFLQAAIYIAATKAKNFYYIGICKQAPYSVFVFNVLQYPERLALAQKELERLCKYIKKKI